jgi:hypothetical protein
MSAWLTKFLDSKAGVTMAVIFAVAFVFGLVNVRDMRGENTVKVITDERAMQLYIERTATDAAEKAVAANDRHWKEWRESTENRLRILERRERLASRTEP